MNERVKELRKSLGLTLEKFGEKVGVKKTTISRIEKGTNNVTEQMFKSICREFNVNEEWLRTGKGNMYIESDVFSLDEFAKKHNFEDLDIEIFKAFFSLDADVRHHVISHLKGCLNSSENRFPEIPDTAEEFEKLYPPIDFDGDSDFKNKKDVG